MAYIEISNTALDGYLKQGGYKVSRAKLWTDAGRNMAGEMKATLIGVFPKISLEFRHLTRAELTTVTGLLDEAVLSVKWFDAKSNSVKTANFYSSDYEYPVYDGQRELYQPFSVNLIAFKKYV